jgi:hypothetical protein
MDLQQIDIAVAFASRITVESRAGVQHYSSGDTLPCPSSKVATFIGAAGAAA